MRIANSVIINASPEKVFAVITDFASYPDWNPWLPRAEGVCREGADVVVDAWVGGRLRPYHHRILRVDSPQVLHWCDKGWFTVLACGNRKRSLKAHPSGTEYTVELNINGPFAFLVSMLLAGSLGQGMADETAALKTYAEQT